MAIIVTAVNKYDKAMFPSVPLGKLELASIKKLYIRKRSTTKSRIFLIVNTATTPITLNMLSNIAKPCVDIMTSRYNTAEL